MHARIYTCRHIYAKTSKYMYMYLSMYIYIYIYLCTCHVHCGRQMFIIKLSVQKYIPQLFVCCSCLLCGRWVTSCNVCMYVCMRTCMHDVCVCLSVRGHVQTLLHNVCTLNTDPRPVRKYMYVCIYIHTHIYIHAYIECMCIYIYIYIFTHTHIDRHTDRHTS
jgi:hypothetical protein